jgi:DNA invertase Pin-like site-specific DNA recombinase
LDRLGRSVAHVASILEQHPGAIVALDIGMTPDSPAGAFTAHVIAAAAELERALIRERTRDALATARQRGTRLGRPREVLPSVACQVRELYRDLGSFQQVAEHLNEQGIKPPRGKRWYRDGVRRVVLQAEAAA